MYRGFWLWEAQSIVFYVSRRLWEAESNVFNVSGMLWEAQYIVFYVSGGGLRGRMSNQVNIAGGSGREGPHASFTRAGLSCS